MRNQDYADSFFIKFSKAEGNQHIASLFALKKVLDIVQFEKPKEILEVGLGIGSISYSILKFLNDKSIKIRYDGTEKNEFCLAQLKINLEEVYDQIKIYGDLDDVGVNSRKYDFIIIDGSDDAITKIKDLIAKTGVLFIEGDRVIQVDVLRKLFPKHKFAHIVSNYKEPDYGPFGDGMWSGGGKLIYVNPTFKQKLNFYKEKIRTAFINKFYR